MPMSLLSPSIEIIDSFNSDRLHEACGVFGIFCDSSAAAHTGLGLHALQHRGQEAAGIVSCDGEQFYSHHGLGHVSENFNEEMVNHLPGNMAIGHVRYATSGDTAIRNVQPLFADFDFGGFAIGHNGNLTNAHVLHRALVRRGCLFQSTTDTEVIVHLIAISQSTSVEDRIIDALRQVEGAYSLVILVRDALMGVRDPLGIRPLVLGRFDKAHVLTSETCALDIIGAEFIRDIDPGELVIVDKYGVHSIKPFLPHIPHRFCVFEYIYFARPDSIVEGLDVYSVRKRIGRELARESYISADVIVPVPDSGVPAAMGYAKESGIPFEYGIIRNHYVGRTFIQPTDHTRHLDVKRKHNPNKSALRGKRVILVDDSIVRGTTSTKIVDMVRQAGATEVHMRVSSPPTLHPCFFGIDTPKREQLLAARYNVKDMASVLKVDSLAFISLDGLYRALEKGSRCHAQPQFCDACFTGIYPTTLTDSQNVDTISLSLLTKEGKTLHR